ncbi:hypothetical protein LPN01_11855 [Sphingomonas sp. A2-49]|uniref:hypothetical protein n=1 Tax=Sphingomonas sp. A2-49 TaxID=1391375 RepID=UPI0021CEAD0E|nr:hypothetical protein [Sphingomonas sp. A2-49]MCU6454771.1 hypothetical protein [Sphingomonas sp. A2-49]
MSVVVTRCPPGGDHDASCRAVEVRRAGRVVRLGGGYRAVSIMPIPAARPGQPAVVVLGDDGGSGGEGDLFALTTDPEISVARLRGERIDGAVVHPVAGRLALDLSFDIEYFNGAPHAAVSIVRMPVVWREGDFAADLTAMVRRPAKVDMLAMRRELAGWAADAGRPARLFPPQASNGTPGTVRALAALILSGHAAAARAALHRAWPRDTRGMTIGGEGAFWSAVCRQMVRHLWWSRFGLDRLPQAALVRAAAGGLRA